MHFVALLKFDIFSEAKGIRAKEMNVQLPGYTVLIVLKVVELQVFQTMCYRFFSRPYWL